MVTDYEKIQQIAKNAVQDFTEAARQLATALQPAIDVINAFGRSLMLDRHNGESIVHYLERMERKERARTRYMRRMTRR